MSLLMDKVNHIWRGFSWKAANGPTTTVKEERLLTSEGIKWQTFKPNRIQGISRLLEAALKSQRSRFHQSESKTNET